MRSSSPRSRRGWRLRRRPFRVLLAGLVALPSTFSVDPAVATEHGEDCWEQCGHRAGYCSWCDHVWPGGGACCKHGEAQDPAECRAKDLVFTHGALYECVAVAPASQSLRGSSLGQPVPQEGQLNKGSGSDSGGDHLLPSIDDKTIEQRVVPVNGSPRIFTVDGFLTDEECDFMKRHGEPHLQQSLTIDFKTGEYHPDPVRTSMQTYISKEDSRDDPVITRIVRRMHRLARVPLGHGEQIQVGRYRVGDKYDCHFDSETRVDVVRPATIIVYVSDVEAGGETIFPMGAHCHDLDECCSVDSSEGGPGSPIMRFHPKKGSALLFYTHDLDGEQNRMALHGACPVVAGEKWIIQAWFRSTLYSESPHYVFDKAKDTPGGATAASTSAGSSGEHEEPDATEHEL